MATIKNATDHFLTRHYWKDVPLFIQFDLTNACNLTCEHCYHPHHKNSGALNYDQWLLVLGQYEKLLRKMKMQPDVSICGGEPFLSPFLFPFLHEIRKRFGNCDLHILTNGTRFTPEIIEKLKPLNVDIQISIDGPDALRHDFIRGHGAFDLTMKGCEMLRSVAQSFYFQTVLGSRSAAWIEDYFELARNQSAQAMNFVRLVAEGQANQLIKNQTDSPLLGQELKNAMERILEVSRYFEIPTNNNGPLWGLLEEGLGGFSDIGINTIVVGYRGEFKPSSRLPLVLGNVLDEGLEDLYLSHPVMRQLRDGKIDTCGSCEHFHMCRGNRNASYVEYGHLFGPDPGCWLLN